MLPLQRPPAVMALRAAAAMGLGLAGASARALEAAAQPGVAHAVVRMQTAFDPFTPWVLAALVLWAWRLARRARGAALFTSGRGRSWSALLLAAAVLAALAGALSVAVASGGHPALLAWDGRAAAWGAGLRAAGWRPVAAQLGQVTDVLPMTALALLVGAALWRRGAGALALGWLLAASINSLWGRVLKEAIARPRPASAVDTLVSGFSFPSGHACGALMVFGLLAWLLCRRLPPAGRWLGAVCAALVIAAVGASRVVLGVHYLSDVLGGLLWAGALLACAVVALRPLADRWARRPAWGRGFQ